MLNSNRLHISPLTLGTVALGMEYGISNIEGKPGNDKAIEIIKKAVDLGVNTFDTARHYGDAEKIIGSYCRQENDHTASIVTKFRISNENLDDPEAARREVYESVKKSLDELNPARISIALFHKRPGQPLDKILKILPPILQSLQTDGLIGRGGFSVFHPSEVEFCIPFKEIEVIQAPVNILDQRLAQRDVLSSLIEHGKIVFARSIFLQGLIFLDCDKLSSELAEAGKYIRLLKDLADKAGMSVAQLAFSFVRDLPGITSIIFGAVNTMQVQDNAQLYHSPALPGHIREAIENTFRNVPEKIITPALWNAQ